MEVGAVGIECDWKSQRLFQEVDAQVDLVGGQVQKKANRVSTKLIKSASNSKENPTAFSKKFIYSYKQAIRREKMLHLVGTQTTKTNHRPKLLVE